MSNISSEKSSKVLGRILWLFLFSIIVLLCFAGIFHQQKKSREATSRWVHYTSDVTKKIGEIKVLIAHAGSATRNAMISGDTVWEQQVAQWHGRAQQLITEVSDEWQKDAAFQKSYVLRLKQLTGTGSGKMLFAGQDPQATKTIQHLLDSMAISAENLLSSRIRENENRFSGTASISVFGAIFSFLLILGLLLHLNRNVLLRKITETDEENSDAKYRNLVENAGLAMYTTDTNGSITFANQQVCILTGYSVNELIGKDFSFLLHPSWMQQVFTHYNNQAQERIPSTTLEFITRTKLGQQVWVEQTAQLIIREDNITGFQCMLKDITEKKRIEQELKESELKRKENQHRLEAIMENTTSMVYIKNLEGRYMMVNRRFTELLGVTEKMVLHKTDYDFCPKEIADHFKALDDEVISTRKPVETEEWVDGPDGRKNMLLIKFPLIDHKKKIFGVSGIATDITDRILYQQKLIEARKNAEEAKQMQEQFLANMSHEIRTPMNGIQGMTNLLMQTELSDQQKEFTGTIKRSVNNLLVIVNDILDFSKIKAGRITIEKIPFNIRNVLENANTQFEHELHKKELTVHVQVENKVPLTVVGDPYRLGQVLVNMIGNAIKFTVSGHVSIQARLFKEMNDQKAVIRFVVADTGIGIPEEKLESVFEAFTQAGADISRNYGGAGLGLAICKGLIELQGGVIAVKSKPGEGSVFSFDIPYELKQETNPEAGKDGSVILKGKRVLIAEDNEVNQKLISYVLKKVGAVADIAGNGRMAIDYIENKEPYDLIIMDIQMPVMDGYQATEYIRQVLKLKTPIIAMTATALKGDQERSVEVGMNDFMLKPFDFDDLYERLVRLLIKDESMAETDAAMNNIKLYDLSLLEGLDDKESLLDVLNLFLDNTPAQVKNLPVLVREQNWQELFHLAHKLKGALAMLQANRISDLLGKIETRAKEGKDITEIPAQVEEVCDLFAKMEIQLLAEREAIQKEL